MFYFPKRALVIDGPRYGDNIAYIYTKINENSYITLNMEDWNKLRSRFDPWFGKIPWRRKWQSFPVFLPGEFHGQENLAGSVHGLQSRTWLSNSHFHFQGHYTEMISLNLKVHLVCPLDSTLSHYKYFIRLKAVTLLHTL